MDTVEIRDKIENLKNDMDGLTVLVHAFLEGLRSDSVSAKRIMKKTAPFPWLRPIVFYV